MSRREDRRLAVGRVEEMLGTDAGRKVLVDLALAGEDFSGLPRRVRRRVERLAERELAAAAARAGAETCPWCGATVADLRAHMAADHG